MSVFNRARVLATAAWPATIVAVLSATAVYADTTIGTGGCVRSAGAFNCVGRVGPAGDPYVRTVPQPANDEERDRATARDRQWIARCHPTIAQDRYGVPRYHYAARGCEFGVIE